MKKKLPVRGQWLIPGLGLLLVCLSVLPLWHTAGQNPARPLTGDPQYQIFDIGVVQAGDSASQAFGISPNGIAGGRSVRTGAAQAFSWTQAGNIVGLPNLTGRSFCVANSANNGGALAGTCATTLFGSSRLPVIWQNGAVAQLPLPPGETLGDAFSVNAAGVAVGSVNGGISQRGAIYSGAVGTVIAQTSSNGSFFTSAFGVNDAGRIVGIGVDPANAARNVPLLYDQTAGTVIEIGALPGFNGAIPFAISNGGHVVGSSMLNQGSGLPFIWTAAGGMAAIPLPTGTSQGSARAVNAAGWAVGNASNAFSIPFLYNGTATYRLQDLIPANSGWDLSMNTSSSAQGISDGNVIVGTGIFNGQTHAYAMVPVAMPTPTPTPIPSAIQFSAATFTASEGAGTATVTVSRNGDTSGTATVDYKTNDNFTFAECSVSRGLADQRCDYTNAAGTLAFAVGETSKSFDIPLTDDFYVEGNEQVNLTLSNAVGGTLGTQNTATLTITDNDTTEPATRLFFARLDSQQEVPANSSTATGFGTALLNATETQITVNMSFSGLGSAQTAAHIHGAAPVGVTAPVLFNFGTGQISNLTFNVSPTQVAQLKAGLMYMNIHTVTNPNGEIRGQILPNPVESARFFVRQQYADFLSRTPDQAGFDYWTGQITATGTDLAALTTRRREVSNAFFFELEYQQTGAYVYRLYRAAFGNNQPFPNTMGDMDSNPYCTANPANCQLVRAAHLPAYANFAADRAQVVGGAQLAATQLALATAFAGRAEFVGRYPLSQSADQYVDALLSTIQAASGANLTSQRSALIALYNGAGSPSAGRGTVLFRLAQDDAAGNPVNNRAFIDAEYNRAFVTTQYYGYLRRDGDLPGLNFWLSVINQSPPRDVTRQLGMVCAFITSAEYEQRFSGYYVRTNQTDCP